MTTIERTIQLTPQAHTAVCKMLEGGLWGATEEEAIQRLLDAQIRHQQHEERKPAQLPRDGYRRF